MKYNVFLFNADDGHHKYQCRILSQNEAPASLVREDAKFFDEDELREKLKTILRADELDKAINELESDRWREVRFQLVEIDDLHLKMLGFKVIRKM